MIDLKVSAFWLMLCLGLGFAENANALDKLVDPLQRSAQMAPQAAHAVMLAVANTGAHMVAAGERGIILWSDDEAKTWKQARVPVSVTITALSFPTPLQGWAVGHGGVILHTSDGGMSWALQLDGRKAAALELQAAMQGDDARRIAAAKRLVADGPDKPLLAVYFWNIRKGFAIGAYGAIYGTEDGGKTWSSWRDRVDNPAELHLNALYVRGAEIFIGGEQGLLLRSEDDGGHFQRMQSPYQGSWFSIVSHGNRLVLTGLRGNVFWSDTNGDSWNVADMPPSATIAASLALKDGRLLFSNQAGVLFISDDGRTLRTLAHAPSAPITALSQTADGTIVAATFAGAVALPIAAENTPSSVGSRH